MNLCKPCYKCPYKLGMIKTLTDPCPQCKTGKYKLLDSLFKQAKDAGQIKEESPFILKKQKIQ